jgi:hypothetical protein
MQSDRCGDQERDVAIRQLGAGARLVALASSAGWGAPLSRSSLYDLIRRHRPLRRIIGIRGDQGESARVQVLRP